MKNTPFRKGAGVRQPAAPVGPNLSVVLELLTGVETTTRPVDAVTSAHFRAHPAIRDEERGAILAELYAVLRHRGRLDWWLARLSLPDATVRTRIIAWLVLGKGWSQDMVMRSWPVTSAEQALIQELKGATLDHAEMPEVVSLECPDWAVAPLRRRFGEAFAAEMAATLAPAPLDLRVNTVRTTREAVLSEMRRLGIEAEPTRLAPHGLRLRERLALSRLPGLTTGAIEIQDEGSQLVAALVDVRPGEQVVDFCAGAGGKTLALAAQMENRGHLVACDVSEARLKRCSERLRRAGLQNAETRLLTGETDRWIKRHKGRFDRVLVDAPCSGTGTWRRNPDARWRTPELGLDGLVALQSRILASAARLVTPGGRLVYATCSLLPEENEDQVAAFLAAHPDFQVVPLCDVEPQVTGSAHPDHLSLTPARHGTDGFFAAVLRRAG